MTNTSRTDYQMSHYIAETNAREKTEQEEPQVEVVLQIPLSDPVGLAEVVWHMEEQGVETCLFLPVQELEEESLRFLD